MELRIYEYSVDDEWDTNHAAAIISESRENADAIYMRSLDHDCEREAIKSGQTKLRVKTRKIQEGMVIVPHGYDYCALGFSQGVGVHVDNRTPCS